MSGRLSDAIERDPDIEEVVKTLCEMAAMRCYLQFVGCNTTLGVVESFRKIAEDTMADFHALNRRLAATEPRS